MRGLNDDYLDPVLRRQIPSPRSSIDTTSVAESTGITDEIVGLNGEDAEKSPSEQPQDNSDTEEDKIQKAKKPRLMPEIVEYQKNARIRDTY